MHKITLSNFFFHMGGGLTLKIFLSCRFWFVLNHLDYVGQVFHFSSFPNSILCTLGSCTPPPPMGSLRPPPYGLYVPNLQALSTPPPPYWLSACYYRFSKTAHCSCLISVLETLGWTRSGPPWTRSGPPWTKSGPPWTRTGPTSKYFFEISGQEFLPKILF